MLCALLSLLVLQTPQVETADDRTHLQAVVAATGGYTFLDLDPDTSRGGLRGAVVGVKVGLHAHRAPLVRGGGRIGFFPALELRQALAVGRTDWLGTLALTVTAWKFIISTGLGYGLSSVAGGAPRSFLALSNQVSLKLGALWLGVSVESALRFGGAGIDGRTFESRLTVGWEFDLVTE